MPRAVVGIVVGSVAGGFTGRAVGRKINRIAFEAAAKQFMSDRQKLEAFLEHVIPDIEGREAEAAKKHKVGLEALESDFVREQKSHLGNLQQEKESLLRPICDFFPRFLSDLGPEIDHAEQQYLDIYGPTFFNKVFPSRERVLAAKRIRKAFDRARRRLESSEAVWQAHILRKRNGSTFASGWTVRSSDRRNSILDRAVADLNDRIQNAPEELRQLGEKMRSKADAGFAEKLNTIYSEGHERLRPYLDAVQKSKEIMIREGRAIGLDFGPA